MVRPIFFLFLFLFGFRFLFPFWISFSFSVFVSVFVFVFILNGRPHNATRPMAGSLVSWRNTKHSGRTKESPGQGAGGESKK